MNYQGSSPLNSFKNLPIVVKNLLIINVLMFGLALLFQSQFGIDLNDKLGMHYPFSPSFRPHQVITYMFMHDISGPYHLFFNMFALWMLGSTLERVWGPKRFLIYYMVTGIGAAVCHYTVVHFQIQESLNLINEYISNPSPASFEAFMSSKGAYVPSQEVLSQYNTKETLDFMRQYRLSMLNGPTMVGASGAIFGILLAFGVLFPNTELLFMFIPIPIKAKWFVLGYGAFELFSGLKGSAGDNIAHFAHLGGMLFGFILLKYWQKQKNSFY